MTRNTRSPFVTALLLGLLMLGVLIIPGCDLLGTTTTADGDGGDEAAATDDASEPVVLDRSDVVTATARLVPAREATLAFVLSGQMIELAVEEGSTVEAGDVLAQLDTTLLDAEVERAEAAVAVADANLDVTQLGPHESQIAESEANIQAATAASVVASAQRDILQNTVPSPSEIARAQVTAQQAYIMMEAERTHYDWVSNTDSRPDEYSEAEKEFLPTQEQLAYQKYQVMLARYNAAESKLDAISHQEANPAEVRAASADLWAASAEAGAQQADLDLLLAGTPSEDIAVAEALVAQAEAQLEMAELARDNAVLIAPFAGTVSEMYLQEAQFAPAGEPVLLLADLNGLHVQTTDLSELDVAGLRAGDVAYVAFDALPGQEFEAEVSRIAPRAQEGDTVNFTVTVALKEVPPGVRWGMTALVEIPRNQ